MSRYFFLQGFYYQHQKFLSLAYGLQGQQVVIEPGLLRSMYAGVIWTPDPKDNENLLGVTQDELGLAELRNITLSETEFSFNKYYEKWKLIPNAYIRYVFTEREKNTWVGVFTFWDGRATPGASRCILTEVDKALFDEDVSQLTGGLV
jgi:hypothetical protein